MKEDLIVAEVRQVRQAHAAEHGNDVRRIVASLRKREKVYQRPNLNPDPKMHLKKIGA